MRPHVNKWRTAIFVASPLCALLLLLLRQSFPDVDVVFNDYKGIESDPPNNRKFAESPLAQQTVRYLKRLRAIYTNLDKPKGMYLEDFVLAVEASMDKDQYNTGASFFDALLQSTFTRIANVSGGGLQGGGCWAPASGRSGGGRRGGGGGVRDGVGGGCRGGRPRLVGKGVYYIGNVQFALSTGLNKICMQE